MLKRSYTPSDPQPASDTFVQWLSTFFGFAPGFRDLEFEVRSRRITRAKLMEVGAAVMKGRVSVVIDADGLAADSANALYDSASNRLVLPTERMAMNVTWESILAHEAVHIINDLEGVTADALLEEGRGLLAMTWYRSANALVKARPADGTPAAVVGAVVDAMRERRRRTGAIPVATPTEVEALQFAALGRGYAPGQILADGLPGM
ncbi:hypothetical protein JQC91_09985 [Jannaschia sp. Os4]|uniref:hypothetical protein n=1 Tax=Jannaschia sp. Os4 TaxID=2807617 RepID=UPI001939308D|nr:hypothetical protein [Jannaschia sp. Os4]MBM2576633.1 hypothetical protein [Jannaschia sp. Os4]